MRRLDQIRLDVQAAVGGVWVEVYPASGGEPAWELLVASTATEEYERIAAEVRAPYEDLIRADRLTPDLRERMHKEIAARAIVKGSRGLDPSEYGPSGEFSQEWALRVLLDPGLHPVWTAVRAAAHTDDRYRAKAIADAAKN